MKHLRVISPKYSTATSKRISLSLIVLVSLVSTLAAYASAPTFHGQIDQTSPAPQIVGLVLNDEQVSSGLVVYQKNDRYWISVEMLESLGINITPLLERYAIGNADRDIHYVDLADIPHVEFSFAASEQRLALTAAPKAFRDRNLQGQTGFYSKADENILTGFLNYRINSAFAKGRSQTDYFLDGGITLPKSVVTSSFITNDGDTDNLKRLETTWTKDLPKHKLRLSLGDAIATMAQGSELSSVYRFGGLQFGTRFELQPGFVSYPIPSIYGEALGKSTVDLFVDEALRYRTETDTGPFFIERPPISTGSGNVRVVVTDLLGRETEFIQPFYVSSRLLDVGLSDYEINVGLLRKNFGRKSNDYGDSFVAARYSRGLSNFLTSQVMAEVSESHTLFGASSIVAFPRFGSAGVHFTASDKKTGEQGNRFGFSYEKNTPFFGLGVRWSRTDPGFVSLQTLESSNRVLEELSASLRMAPFDNASLSLIYTDRKLIDTTDIEITSLTYSQRLKKNWGLTLSASRIDGSEFDDDLLLDYSDDRVELSLVYTFGDRQSASYKVKQQRNELEEDSLRQSLSLRKSKASGVGYSYRLLVEEDNTKDSIIGRGSLDWTTTKGVAQFGFSKNDSSEALSLGFDGSLVLAKGNLFMQRPLRGGFAIAKTGGAPKMKIYRGGKLEATTNRNGLAVLPELVPYASNMFKINPDEFPFYSRIEYAKIRATPYFKGAVSIDFGVTNEKAELIVVKLTDGSLLSAGAIISSDQTNFFDRSGYRGEVYLRGMDKGKVFLVEHGKAKCKFTIEQVRQYLDGMQESVVCQQERA